MNRFTAAAARNLTLGASIVGIFAASASAQQDYPNRPVRLVSGYAPGGTTSLVGSLIGQEFTESWGQQFNGGKVKALAITGKKRSPLLPEVPTFEEAGMANFHTHKRAGYGIVAPAGTPARIIEKLAAEVTRHLAQPAFCDTLLTLGPDPQTSTPKEYAEALKASMAWNISTVDMLKEKGVRFDS